jgi:hypothetical protein
MHFLYLVFLLTALLAGLLASHVGINNGGNHCYMSSVVQNLYHNPTLRDSVYQATAASEENPVEEALACVFARLQEEREPIYMSWDFHPRYVAAADPAWGVLDGAADDPELMLRYLTEEMAPTVRGQLLTTLQTEFEAQLLGDKYHVWRQDAYTTRTISLNMNGYEGQTVEEALNHMLATSDWTARSTDNAALNDVLYSNNLMGETVPAATLTNIINTSNTLAIHVRPSFKVDFRTPRAPSDNKLLVVYPDWMTVGPHRFRFTGVIHALPGHYNTTVCVDAATDTWYNFDDSKSSLSNRHDALSSGGDAFMLFYVRETEWDKWATTPDLYSPTVPDKIRKMNEELARKAHRSLGSTGESIPNQNACPLTQPIIDGATGIQPETDAVVTESHLL